MKTKRDLINEIKVNEANFEYCAKKGKINGSLLVDIERIMEEYADKQLKLCEVVKSVKEKKEITFQDWANIKGFYKTENGWFNENGTQRLTTELIDMYFDEYPL